MIDKNDFPDLPSTAQQIFDAFLADEAPFESIEQLATSAWELILQVWRDIHQAPTNEEHPEIDRRLTQLIEQWDSDDPNLAIIEKMIKRLAEGRGKEAIEYVERSIKNKSEEFSKLQSSKARKPRNRDKLTPLINEIAANNPDRSNSELARDLKKYDKAGVITSIEDGEIWLDGVMQPIKLSGIDDRIARAKKKNQPR